MQEKSELARLGRILEKLLAEQKSIKLTDLQPELRKKLPHFDCKNYGGSTKMKNLLEVLQKNGCPIVIQSSSKGMLTVELAPKRSSSSSSRSTVSASASTSSPPSHSTVTSSAALSADAELDGERDRSSLVPQELRDKLFQEVSENSGKALTDLTQLPAFATLFAIAKQHNIRPIYLLRAVPHIRLEIQYSKDPHQPPVTAVFPGSPPQWFVDEQAARHAELAKQLSLPPMQHANSAEGQLPVVPSASSGDLKSQKKREASVTPQDADLKRPRRSSIKPALFDRETSVDEESADILHMVVCYLHRLNLSLSAAYVMREAYDKGIWPVRVSECWLGKPELFDCYRAYRKVCEKGAQAPAESLLFASAPSIAASSASRPVTPLPPAAAVAPPPADPTSAPAAPSPAPPLIPRCRHSTCTLQTQLTPSEMEVHERLEHTCNAANCAVCRRKKELTEISMQLELEHKQQVYAIQQRQFLQQQHLIQNQLRLAQEKQKFEEEHLKREKERAAGREKAEEMERVAEKEGAAERERATNAPPTPTIANNTGSRHLRLAFFDWMASTQFPWTASTHQQSTA